MRHLIKLIIRIFAGIIKQNRFALKYLYTVALENETTDFIDHGYGETTPHIKKTAQLAVKYKFDKDHIMDIGGAKGATALLFREYLPSADITIFEPLKENHEGIQKIVSSKANMKLIPKALGNEHGEKIIHRTSRITSSSLLNLSEKIDSDYMKEALKSSVEETILISRLDDEAKDIPSVGIIKIDVQGFELEVLKGAVETLKKTKLVVVEVSNHKVYDGAPMYYEVDEFLRANGFSLYDNCLSFKEKGRLREWDGIYMKDEMINS